MGKAPLLYADAGARLSRPNGCCAGGLLPGMLTTSFLRGDYILHTYRAPCRWHPSPCCFWLLPPARHCTHAATCLYPRSGPGSGTHTEIARHPSVARVRSEHVHAQKRQCRATCRPCPCPAARPHSLDSRRVAALRGTEGRAGGAAATQAPRHCATAATVQVVKQARRAFSPAPLACLQDARGRGR